MDDQRFDELVMRLCTIRLTRLSALRGLVGGAAALAGAVLVSEETEAKKDGTTAEEEEARSSERERGSRPRGVRQCRQCVPRHRGR